MDANFHLSMGKAAHILATAIARIAKFRLVLRGVVRDFLLGVCIGAHVAKPAFLTRVDPLTHDVPVAQLASHFVHNRPAPLRFKMVPEALHLGILADPVPWAVTVRKLHTHHCVILEDVVPVFR
jgi:hypothetical protein